MDKRKPLKLRLAGETPSEPLAAAERSARGRESGESGSVRTQDPDPITDDEIPL
jgi:hypothetical protein